MAKRKQDKQTLEIDDFAKIRTIEELDISPDGERAAFTVKSMNLDKNRYDSDIYIVSTSGGETTKITDCSHNYLPKWSPDGRRIAFVQNIEEKRSIWLMDPNGENKRKITDYDISNASLGVYTVCEAIRWSPDGSMIAFLASLGPFEKNAKIKVITRLMYKAFYGYSDMRRRHIFVVSPLGYESPRQLTFGDFDEHSICWSPDSREIAFISNRTGMDDFNMHMDIWSVDMRNGRIRRITETKGAEYYPTWSPDGGMIAYTATTKANTSNESTPEDRHVWVVNSNGSEAKELTLKLDRTCNGPPCWTPDGDRILFTVYDEGRVPIYSVTPDGERVIKIMTGDRWLSKVSVAKKAERMVYVSNNPTNPGELYSADLNGDNEFQLTNLNGFFVNVYLSEPEYFTFKSFDDTEIQGWILKPKCFDPSKKYPALLNIKGGPSGMRGYGFNTHLQVGPAYGYIQIYVNYRGSSGYGQAFSDAVVGDMLGGEFKDNMGAVNYIIKTRSYVDPKRMGVWGVSYGGYLTNWTVTQTNRFKAAVAISSISNLFSQWGSSALPLWLEVEIEGLPWDRMDLMLKQSPIMQANRAKTPILFLHGEMDFVTPIVEAEQMFMAMKKNGVETMMVRYTDDGHGIRKKPINQLDLLRRVIAWFDKQLKPCVQATS